MNFWKNLSVSNKLFSVVGIMALLVTIQLVAMIFAVNTLSAVRGYVGGEGQWSKGQKDAIIALQNYVITQDEAYYEEFFERINVTLGDRTTRLEMQKVEMDYDIAYEGMIHGNIHHDDIDKMIALFRKFHWNSYFTKALENWITGDEYIIELMALSNKVHEEMRSRSYNDAYVKKVLDEIAVINRKLTDTENNFSKSLGDASRWIERIMMISLISVVILISAIGFILAFMFSKFLTKSLNELIEASHEVGKGNYNQVLPIRSGDEIGKLAESLNMMVTNLREQRTAVNIRDEFLSMASHELKTPLTTLKLQIQMRKRKMEKGDVSVFNTEKMKRTLENEDSQINRLVRLVEDMLDISRIRVGKFNLRVEEADLVKLASDVLLRLEPQIKESNSQIQLVSPESLPGVWDSYRLEQVMINLLTNAMKYGNSGPITLQIDASSDHALIAVKDNGIGISLEDRERIFEQFERAVPNNTAAGLGLGLYIVKQIIDAHKGEIKLESEVGKGSTFMVRLPLIVKQN